MPEKFYRAGDGPPVRVWFNDEKPEPFPTDFGTLGDVGDTGKAQVIGPDGSRTTIGEGDVVFREHGVLRFMKRRTFDVHYQETTERPPESRREEFERRQAEQPPGDAPVSGSAHPGEVKSGSEGKARQGMTTASSTPPGSGAPCAGVDEAGAKRSGSGVDPSGTVPGAPLGASPGDPNTGGSPHEKSAGAAQPEVVQRGTDAKVEQPEREAMEGSEREQKDSGKVQTKPASRR